MAEAQNENQERPPTSLSRRPHELVPNIGLLPEEVADRLDDMSYALAMAVEYVPMKVKHDRLYEYGVKMQDIALGKSSLIPTATDGRFSGIGGRSGSWTFDGFIEEEVNNDPDRECDLQFMIVSHTTCVRVGVQCALGLFQSAMDSLWSNAAGETWLLMCLRELRNIVVHHVPLTVATKDHRTDFVHRTGEIGPAILTEGEWFFDVKATELTAPHPMMKGKPRLCDEKAEWFVEVCAKHSISRILLEGVWDMLHRYAEGNPGAIESRASNERRYRAVYITKRGRVLRNDEKESPPLL